MALTCVSVTSVVLKTYTVQGQFWWRLWEQKYSKFQYIIFIFLLVESRFCQEALSWRHQSPVFEWTLTEMSSAVNCLTLPKFKFFSIKQSGIFKGQKLVCLICPNTTEVIKRLYGSFLILKFFTTSGFEALISLVSSCKFLSHLLDLEYRAGKKTGLSVLLCHLLFRHEIYWVL